MSAAVSTEVEARAAASRGTSSDAIYRMVRRAIVDRHSARGVLVDVGCGAGRLWPVVHDLFDCYAGVDAVHYEGFPANGEFTLLDLDSGRAPLEDGVADVVACVETIEHVENPRALVRELTRLVKPGGLVIITTPNQLSFLSKLTLVLKNQFNAFTDSSYPAHLTALLECDLRRIATECGLRHAEIVHSLQGRIPGLARHWPLVCSRWLPRALSDNVGMIANATIEHQAP